MAYDQKVRDFFEIADDGIQGVIGYYLYVEACQNITNKDDIVDQLPDNFHITFHWTRNYDPERLCDEMKMIFPYYHSRIGVINIISIFEGALGNFINRLVETGNLSKPLRNYKKRLEWAFDVVKNSTMGDQKTLDRIPDICLHVDHARRIRNLWMHNNGLIDEYYGDKNNGIVVQGNPPIIDKSYNEFMKTKKKIAINVTSKYFKVLNLSHIELLHHLHDTIQKMYFGDTIGYSYTGVKKTIEWHRVLTGQ